MKGTGLIVTIAVHVGVIGLMWGASAFGSDFESGATLHDDKINVIETGLAIRKKKKRGRRSRLPRKQRAPKRDTKNLGVASDPNAKPNHKEPNLEDRFNRFRDIDIDEEDIGEAGTADDTDIGKADGSEFGTLADAKGDPYVGELGGRMTTNPDMIVPSMVKAGGLTTLGCVRLNAAGKIIERFVDPDHKSKNRTFNRAVAERLKITTDMPKPVPPHLIQILVKDGICAAYTY